MKVDLGSGGHKVPGFVGVDISPDCQPDIVHDLRVMPWPFDDQSVEEVNCSHFFEHLDGDERVAFMEELYRIMKPGAVARMTTPFWSSMGAVQDPTHRWPPLAQGSYQYFNKKWRDMVRIDHYGIQCDFDLRFELKLNPEWQQKSPAEQQFAVKHYFNVVNEMTAVLTRR